MNFYDTVKASKVDLGSLFPYAGLVPKHLSHNLEWRKWMNACGVADELDRQAILDACKDDLLFFINGFLWIKQEQPVPLDRPFITWPRQDEYVRLIVERRLAVEADLTGKVRGDTLAEKPRQVGWSWLNLAEHLQMIRFVRGATTIIGSRVQDDVDKRGASKTLFWKLDYLIEHLPRWFMPENYWSARYGYPIPHPGHRSCLKLVVPGFGTALGSATHENFGRSGQYALMLLDEFAFTDRGQAGMGEKIWSGTTNNCRVRRAVSTPYGRGNKFAALRHSGSLPVFTVQWTDDPAKMVDCYRLEIPLVVGPVTVPVGEWWSGWAESARKSDDNDALFAQEVLLSYEGLGGSFYDALLPRVKHEQLKEPVWTGCVTVRDDAKGPRVSSFTADAGGFLKSWLPLPAGLGIPSARIVFPVSSFPVGLYCMGIDVASGSRNLEGRGASNSVIAVGRIEGRKLVKVCQYMTHGLLPHLFARMVCGLGWLFRASDGMPAYAVWENQGPGDAMGQTLMREFNYPNCHWEQTARGASPGFYMQTFRKGDGTLTGSKVNVFNEHKKWLEMGDYAEPSYDTYREMEQYRYTQDSGAEHHRVSGSLDPGEGRSNHGDSVIATVLMIWAARFLRERQGDRTVESDPPPMSVAAMQKKLKREAVATWR